MKYLCTFCGLFLAMSFFAMSCLADDTKNLSRELELLNSITRAELRLENQELEARVKELLSEIEIQNASS